MNIKEIKDAVSIGLKVIWVNNSYHVVKGANGDYLIVYQGNGHTIGLTNLKGNKLNGNEDEFHIVS
jgi:hypothetical protein